MPELGSWGGGVREFWQCPKENVFFSLRPSLRADKEEGKSVSKVTNQIFGHLQHLKNEVRYLENIFFRLEKHFPHKGVFFTKVTKASIIAFIETKILTPVLSVKNTPFKNVSP